MKSSSTKYGAIAITVHWLTAILIIAQLASGFRAYGSTDDTTKAEILSIHVVVGLAILALMLFRLSWWLFLDKKPLSPEGDPAWQTFGAKAVHYLFYIVVFGMITCGIGLVVLSGAGPIISGETSGPLPDFHEYLPRVPHGLGARLLMLLILVHASAALYHQFIKKDGLLWRMWYSSKKGA